MFAVLSAAMEQAGLFSLLSRLLFFSAAFHGNTARLLQWYSENDKRSASPKPLPDGLRLRLTLVAFLVSFGGLSILGQTFGVLAAMPISKKDYIKGKLINALFSSLSFLFALSVFYPYAQKKFLRFFAHRNLFLRSFFSGFLPSLFFLAVLCYAISRRG